MRRAILGVSSEIVATDTTHPYYKTKHSTLKDFTIFRIHNHKFYSVTRFFCGPDLSLNVSFNICDLNGPFYRNLTPIEEEEYNEFMIVYNIHIKNMLLKIDESPHGMNGHDGMHRLTNPFWRMRQLLQK